MPTPLVAALLAGNRPALDRVLAAEIAFHSPVRTYRERDEVLHLLGLIGGLLDSTVARTVEARDESVTFLEGRVGEHVIEGALDERRAPDGQVVEITLMLRPLKALLAAVDRMGAGIAAA